jgi:hypothetical protein
MRYVTGFTKPVETGFPSNPYSVNWASAKFDVGFMTPKPAFVGPSTLVRGKFKTDCPKADWAKIRDTPTV